MKKYFRIYLTLTIFAIGTAIGSIYSAGITDISLSELSSYISDYLKNGLSNRSGIFIASLRQNLTIFSVIFISGFFRAGVCPSLAVVMAYGFISGFTATALIRIYASKGILFILSLMPSTLVTLTALLFFSAYSLSYSVNPLKNEKNIKKQYSLVSLFLLTIFCVASLIDGYITTIFMSKVVTLL